MNGIALLLSFLLVLTPVSTDGVATWYGNGFIGKHHAAYWHEKTPSGAPNVVDDAFFGIAAPNDIPFGTKLLLIRESTCMKHSSPYDGSFVFATVIDRKARHEIPHYYDLWPATAKALGFGPFSEGDAGCLKVQVYVIKEKETQ